MPLDATRWQIEIAAADKTAQAFTAVQRRLESIDIVTKGVSSAMATQFALMARSLGPIGAGLTAAALASKAWTVAMDAGALLDQAEQLGLTTDQLQGYRYAAIQAGVGADQMDQAMVKLAGSMSAANNGNDDMIAKFEKLGVKLLDANGNLRKQADVLPELARGLMKMESETERAGLMQDILGGKGQRLVTVLGQIAQGNDQIIDSAREQNVLIDSESIKTLNRLGNELTATQKQAEALWASFAAPIAADGLNTFNEVLRSTSKELKLIKEGWDWISSQGGRTTLQGMQDEAAGVQARINKLHADGADTPLRAAELQREYTRLGVLQQKISDAMTAAYTLPPITVPGEKGVSQPAGKKAAADAATAANKRLAESQRAMDDLVAQSAKDFEAAQQIIFKYGDGTAYAAAETEKLNEALAFISDPKIILQAQKEIADKAADMERAYRGAQGGVDGFMAGIEQGMADMERANSAFNVGKQMINEFSQAIGDLATGAEVDFGRILSSFLSMLSQMAMQAAASQIFGALGGSAGGGILNLIGGTGAGATGGGLLDGIFTTLMGSPFMADGGPVSAGRSYIVGEEGPELFRPNQGGTIFNRDQLSDMGGGGTTVVVNQTVHVGEYVTSTEWRAGLRAMRKSTEQAAKNAIVRDRMRAGPIKTVFNK